MGDSSARVAPAIDSPDELDRVLALGLGRAILFLRQRDGLHQRDAAPYRRVIRRHVLHWTGYDQQLEGARTTYLIDVLDAADLYDAACAPILRALRKTTDSRDFTQLEYLALAYAQDGDADARAALYELLEEGGPPDEPFPTASVIVKLDGLDGLLHVADRMGASLLARDGRLSVDGWPFAGTRWATEDALGEDEARAALEAAAQDNPRIAAFLHAATVPRERKPFEFDGAPYEQVKQAISEVDEQTGTKRFWPRTLARWGRDASDDDIARSAVDLLAEQDAARLAVYLQIFEYRPFPLGPERLLSLLAHPHPEVAGTTKLVLKASAGSGIRGHLLTMLSDPALDGLRKSHAAELLVSNYEPGDEALLADLFAAPWDRDELHWIGMSVRDVLEAHPSPAAVPLWMDLYERGPCSFCREFVVAALKALEAAPGWMLDECRLDASMDTRDLADAWASGDDDATLDTIWERQLP